MTHISSDPATFRRDFLEGLVSLYDRYVEAVPGASGVQRSGGARIGKVAVVIGGGSGHYPAFSGLVGAGLADASVVGDIFTSPSAEQVYRVAQAVEGGAGVLLSFGNYTGDVLNFGLAQERLRKDGVDCRTVLVTDDIASAPPEQVSDRRGIAGVLAVFKAAGAAAARGASLDDVERVARRMNAATRTLGVAFAACTLPGRREPHFEIRPGTYHLGLGIHGEPGIQTVDAVPVAELARRLVEPLLAERPAGSGRRAAVILNGLGATKYEELFVLWGCLSPLLAGAGVEPVLPEVGEFITSLDMAGCSLTLSWLDNELSSLWSAPVDAPGFRRGDVSSYPAFPQRSMTRPLPVRGSQHQATAAGPGSKRAADLCRVVLVAMLAAAERSEVELSHLDSVAGDGDHGTAMVRGLRAATAAADTVEGGIGTVLVSAGQAFADRGGGTSGLLWGLMLESIGDNLGDAEQPTAARLAEAIRCGAETIGRVGHARLGDKTMLDALVPFADALAARVAAGAPLRDAWVEAAETATRSAEQTAGLRPRVGRARPLAERSLGAPDPGAVSLAICATAAGEVLRDRLNRAEPSHGDARGARAT